MGLKASLNPPNDQMVLGVFPLFLPSAMTALEGTEGCFSLAIIAFRAFEFIVRKYYYFLGQVGKRSLDSLI